MLVPPPRQLVFRRVPMLGEHLPEYPLAQSPFRGEPGGPRSVLGAAIRVRQVEQRAVGRESPPYIGVRHEEPAQLSPKPFLPTSVEGRRGAMDDPVHPREEIVCEPRPQSP